MSGGFLLQAVGIFVFKSGRPQVLFQAPIIHEQVSFRGDGCVTHLGYFHGTCCLCTECLAAHYPSITGEKEVQSGLEN